MLSLDFCVFAAMNYKDLDIITLKKHLINKFDHITCINCCKYYLNPTTAKCGHSLCYSCWWLNHSCPSCGLKIDKKALTPNSTLQILAEHATLFRKAFENLFNIKWDEFTVVSDKQERVDKWLTNSENQRHQITTNIQIHNRKLIEREPAREIIQMNLQQDDWDKIEEIPETAPNRGDLNQKKDNPILPMDTEVLDVFVNKEYNTHNPRRSVRNKEFKCNNPCITTDISSKKENETSFNINSDKKSKQIGHHWKNVNKMKKEFCKLNVKNRNKLNVSTEMCKKTKITSNKEAPSKQEVSNNVDDNIIEIACTNEVDYSDTIINKEILTEVPIDDLKTTDTLTKAQSNSVSAHVQDIHQNSFELQNKIEKNVKQVKTTKFKLFKRGPLHTGFTDKTLQTSSSDKNFINAAPTIKSKDSTVNSAEPIEITIKIGKTITNICIQSKEKDVQVKTNTDREIQTSLGNSIVEINHNIHGTSKENTQHVEIGENSNFVKVNDDISQHNSTIVPIQKSASTKKNTTSADTSTAHCEMTESEEKELADHMENVPFINELHENLSQNLSKPECTLKSKGKDQRFVRNLEAIQEDGAYLKDVDLFEDESVKEINVRILKSTKSTPSAIIMPTNKSKSRSQKNTAKRNRDNDTEKLVNIKKTKLSLESVTNNKNLSAGLTENMNEESENINYDAIMSQVFANIKADMENTQKIQPQLHTQISSTKIDKETDLLTAKSNKEQDNILKCTNKKNSEEAIQKCSENMFSLLEKENGNSEIHPTSHMPIGLSQQHKLISLASVPNIDVDAENKEELSLQNDMDIEFATPVHDDDDKSVVEETPQKTTSFSKSRNKNVLANLNDDSVTEHCQLEKNKSINEPGSQLRSVNNEESFNVISISDSAGETTDVGKTVLDTPVTITKFVDRIVHNSTPVARKSLNFRNGNDPDETIGPSSMVVAKTTQEREFMSKAFEHTLESDTNTNTQALCAGGRLRGGVRRGTEMCVAGSCLSKSEQAMLKALCSQRKWVYVATYTKDLTHLVVGVDEENQAQRSVKYICALANSKWILRFAWVEKCLQTKSVVDEEPFEALDLFGEPGPRRSRLAKTKLFQGLTFYCMAPFTIIDIETLKDVLEASGGRVLTNPLEGRAARVPALLVAEPEHTQEDRFTYLAMELQIVPINYEWALNCLGTYTLKSIFDLLLCPVSILPPAINNWPPELISPCDE